MALTWHLMHYWPFPGYDTKNIRLESDGNCSSGRHDWDRETGEEIEPPATLAHVGFEIVAQTLAAPIRRAYEQHSAMDTEIHMKLGRADCQECRDLLAMLPGGDQPVVIG